MQLLQERFNERLPKRKSSDPQYVTELVDAILDGAREASASDVHLIPESGGLRMQWRIDGVLQNVAVFPAELVSRVVARLKVLAELLTYKTEIPQEGRIRVDPGELETRISTFPTVFGEKAVVRLFAEPNRFATLSDLGLPADVLTSLETVLQQTSGALLVVGPAGSGKTTTVYACLRELVDKSAGGRSLVTMEDPVEVIVPGTTQSQVNSAAAFDMETGLRSLMRQDPEVILVGEIRDQCVAEVVFQASLTGHLVLSTFHAGSAASAISRLADMGIEPYLLRSGLLGILSQRLIRQLCHCCRKSDHEGDRLGLPVSEVCLPVGCDECGGTGYIGRMVLSEMMRTDRSGIRAAILARGDSTQLEQAAVDDGMVACFERACQAVRAGLTSPVELRRVLGF